VSWGSGFATAILAKWFWRSDSASELDGVFLEYFWWSVSGGATLLHGGLGGVVLVDGAILAERTW